MSMTDAEKERVILIENKIGKPGYKVKIRIMYMSPKNRVDKVKRFFVIGAFRPIGSAMTNKIKPLGTTWLGVDPIISYGLEAPYLEWKLKRLKRRHFKGYKNRDMHLGAPPMLFNTEELATLYHFPITTRPIVAGIEKTESKKAEAPSNLPIGEIE